MANQAPRINRRELVMVAVAGQIAHPVGAANPYRIGNDGIPRVLPATGGIVINHRIGDRCVGLAGDHIEPGVALHNNQREVVGPRNGPNRALITYACVGNRARVASGTCAGQWGLVTGNHGGVDHVIVDFPPQVLRRLNIGDRIQIYSCGLGLRLLDYPGIEVFNCSPALLSRWGIVEANGRLEVPVTHRVPARIMGSGLGKNSVWRGITTSSCSIHKPAAASAWTAFALATWSPSKMRMSVSDPVSGRAGRLSVSSCMAIAR